MDSLTNTSAVGLEFRFAGPAGADAAAEPRQRGPGAGEPRQHVLELRQLDLPLAFARARAPREDVENQLRAIDHFAIEAFLDVPELGRRQLVVEDDDIGGKPRAFGRELVELAAADERRRIGRRPLLNHRHDDDRAGRFSEPRELVDRALGIQLFRSPKCQADERGPFAEPAVAPAGAMARKLRCHLSRKF